MGYKSTINERGSIKDALPEFEKESESKNYLFVVAYSLYLLMVLVAAVYFFWLFNDPFPEVLKDGELQGLLLIHIFFPLIAITLFILKKKLGWALLAGYSLLNAAYGFVVYLIEFEFDLAMPFFLIQLLLLGLLYQKKIKQTLYISTKWLQTTTYTIIVLAVIFIVLLLIP